MLVLAQFAFVEYSRSAANTAICLNCNGSGFVERLEEVVKHPEIFNAEGEEVCLPIIKHEDVEHLCTSCNGKGVLAARCRCGGHGEVLDRRAAE